MPYNTIVYILALSSVISIVFAMRVLYSQRRLRIEERDRKMMVALLSHRLRTPLTSMKWYLEMLLDQHFGKLQIAQMELVSHLSTSVKDAIDILNIFLESSKVERGDVSTTVLSLDIEEALRDTIATISTLAKNKNHTIEFHELPHRLTVLVNPLILHMILEVVLHNAVSYTPDHGNITIDAKDDGKHVYVSVRDNGIGMTKEDISHLYTKFFRSPKGVEMDTSGNGLGLYLVKDVLSQIGGSIDVQSEPGKGSVFTLKFPNAGMTSGN